MKLQRFVADTTKKAIQKVHDTLGAEALIYSTKTTAQGVEIMAALSHESVEEQSFTQKNQVQSFLESHLVSQLKDQVTTAIDKINLLSRNIDQGLMGINYLASNETEFKKNFIFYHLVKLGFCKEFCHYFINDYFNHKEISAEFLKEEVLFDQIKQYVNQHLKLATIDLVDKQGIYAFIGPSGSGKTSSLIKILKKVVHQYGAASVAILLTDEKDIIEKNKLIYHANLLNVEIQHVNNPRELSLALNSLKHKRMVLLDTSGVSYKDKIAVEKLFQLIESQGDLISCYLTLPANLQETVLKEMVQVFNRKNLVSCLLTKVDESSSVVPVLGRLMIENLSLDYLFHGQNLHEPLHMLTMQEVMAKIFFKESNDKTFPHFQVFESSKTVNTG